MDTITFNQKLLCCLLKSDSGTALIPLVDSIIFITDLDRSVFILLQRYYKAYQKQPTQDYLSNYASQVSTAPEAIINHIAKLYAYDLSDHDYPYDTLLKDVKVKQTRAVIEGFIQNVDSFNVDQVSEFTGKLSKILALGKDKEKITNVGLDEWLPEHCLDNPTPTCYASLNTCTEIGGFQTPELIVFAAPPKSFKTHFVQNLAVGFAQLGKKVQYIDFENGQLAIANKFRRIITCCNALSINDPVNKEKFSKAFGEIKDSGGNLKFMSVKPQAESVKSIQDALEIDEYVPDVIIWDYPDLLAAERGEQLRLKLKRVYLEIIGLNIDLKCFSLAISPVNRGATFHKGGANQEDIGEDFSKLYNAHAMFSLYVACQNDRTATLDLNIMAQRRGKGKMSQSVRYEVDITTGRVYEKVIESAPKEPTIEDEPPF